MGRAIDLFVTYRFIKLLVTPFKDTDAFKLGIIDEDGNKIKHGKRFTLCGCNKSENLPFCDGSHKD